MKPSNSHLALLILTVLISRIAWSQDAEVVFEDENVRIERLYQPRYVDQTCPPEYPGNRARMEKFFTGKSPANFRQKYGAPIPDSISDVKLLNEKEDLVACRYFNNRFEENINVQYRFCEDGIAYYQWDYTYYKSEAFYFVVRSGGGLTEDDPERSECTGSFSHISKVPPVGIYLRDDFSPVPFWN